MTNRFKALTASLATTTFLVLLMVFAAFSAPTHALAANGKIDYSRYLQTTYSSDNGLLSGESNDVVSTPDGILWIATYAGLYRYTGNSFQYLNTLENVKNANCLFVDEEGRLWVGTNDDGVSVLVNEEPIACIGEDQGLPSNSIRSIRQASNGTYYVGTSSSLSLVDFENGNPRVKKTFKDIVYAVDMSADTEGHVAAATAAGTLYFLNDREILQSLTASGNVHYTACFFAKDGTLYAGTDQGQILHYRVEEEALVLESTVSAGGLDSINSLKQLESGDLFICSENGAGWIDVDGNLQLLNAGSFNNSIDRMIQDYQGNLWFSSSRMGVLRLSESAFAEIYPEANLESTVVNAIAGWNGRLYFGTDDGLDVVDAKTHVIVTDELSEALGDARVRCLMVDNQDRMWACVYNVGLVCADKNGDIQTFTLGEGSSQAKFRSVIQLRDGTIAASSNKGISFVRDGVMTSTITEKDGLSNSLVLTLLELKDGTLLAGTDGGGIAVIRDGKVVRTISRQDGLGSGVILRLVQNKGTNDVFVVASNGLCYLSEDGTIRKLDNFPYSNNYDLYDPDNGTIYVTSSAGIFVVQKQDLVNNDLSEYESLNYLSGLRGTFTANAWSYIDDVGYWYIAGNTGVTQFNYAGWASRGKTQYLLQVRSMTFGGSTLKLFGQNAVTLTRDIESVEILPEIINYSVTEPYVRYYLEGLESDTGTVMLQSELENITYALPDPGTYRFHLQILDSRNGSVVEEQVYTITKEYALYDHLWFKVLGAALALALVAWLSWFITKRAGARALDLQKRETELARRQVDMGNQTILAIAHTVDAKDSRTSHHSTRVSQYAVMIARRMGYSIEELENLRRTALLHDIGKIGIPDAVLNKPDKLTDEEYKIMKSHVTIGGDILKDFTLLPHVQEGALYHHERFDGKGYSAGLKGKEIPETARIIGVADAFDAMTADRVYRPRLNFDIVLDEMRKGRGTQFDPDIVDILMELIDEGLITQDGPQDDPRTR